MEEERFVSGFCKAQNQTRMVICVFEETAPGSHTLVETDCAWGCCEHSASCRLIAAAVEESV